MLDAVKHLREGSNVGSREGCRNLGKYGWRDFYNVRSKLYPGEALAVKCVAVVGSVGDWTAYMWTSDKTDREVAERGDKMTREAAEALFPMCVRAGLKWRY